MRKFFIAGLGLSLLAGCATQQQRNIITVACTADTLAPAMVAAAGTVAAIANPADVAAVEAANAADRAVHPVVQTACAQALAKGVPVASTVNVVAVPVAAPVSQTDAVILPVAAPVAGPKAQ